MKEDLQEHWDSIYGSHQSNELSWTQATPATSLNFIHSFNVAKDASIIDIGGGDSRLVDYLVDEGFTNITVLDISETALNKAKLRLGKKASKVKWIVSDVVEFRPIQKFEVWHDRATFHFLTTKEQVEKYVRLAARSINDNGYMVIGTFSKKGPTTCSGLDIKQYSEEELESALTSCLFRKIKCIHEDHQTPFLTIQNFLFCSFRKTS